jgi:DMSO/TMAO reductase YedYZ molybdopterin-dependent catalytic subunit
VSYIAVLFHKRATPLKKKYITLSLTITILGLLLLTPIKLTQADNPPNLEITNLSSTNYEFTYAQILAMPQTVVPAALYCDGALVTYGNWSGVLCSYLLTQAQATPEVGSIQLVASDGYKVAIPIDLATQPQIIIAYEKDGQPLTEGLRLIIPNANGGSWIAKITTITMSTSGADYPQAISIGNPNANNKIPLQNPTQTPHPQQSATVQPQPTTTQNPSNPEQATPTNATQPTQPATKAQVTNQSINLQTIIVMIGVVCAISLTAASYMVVRRKRSKL